ncbi:MAG TPA: acyl-CoA dehydrogenase family protein [Acidimicrobiales bacterium]|nr:acyl-CoA dehydrogenase family protein [Acidimicrobiales bacterium]
MILTRGEMREVVAKIADEYALPNADDVDRQARFPIEAIDGLKSAGVLSALVPPELGGLGATLSEAGDSIAVLSRRCSSSAMILAMHHLQVACLAAHGNNGVLRTYLADVADRQLLLASATTEVGVGGQLRTSRCALEASGGRFRLEKQAGVISYGAHADAVLATCRSGPDAAPSDQVLVLCVPPGLELEQTTEWDTLGFRGTCSPGFALRAEGEIDQVLTDPFGDIAGRTMLPVSHVLWAFVWLGLASAALTKARNYIQGEARKNPGSSPAGAPRLAELAVVHQQLESLVRMSAQRFDQRADGEDQSMGFALSFNSLKVAASTLLVDIVTRALGICGMAGYSQTSPFSMGRLLRDAHGAALMVNNDRILGDNAQLLLIYKES